MVSLTDIYSIHLINDIGTRRRETRDDHPRKGEREREVETTVKQARFLLDLDNTDLNDSPLGAKSWEHQSSP